MSEEVSYAEWGLHCTGWYGNAHFFICQFLSILLNLLLYFVMHFIFQNSIRSVNTMMRMPFAYFYLKSK